MSYLDSFYRLNKEKQVDKEVQEIWGKNADSTIAYNIALGIINGPTIPTSTKVYRSDEWNSYSFHVDSDGSQWIVRDNNPGVRESYPKGSRYSQEEIDKHVADGSWYLAAEIRYLPTDDDDDDGYDDDGYDDDGYEVVDQLQNSLLQLVATLSNRHAELIEQYGELEKENDRLRDALAAGSDFMRKAGNAMYEHLNEGAAILEQVTE